MKKLLAAIALLTAFNAQAALPTCSDYMSFTHMGIANHAMGLPVDSTKFEAGIKAKSMNVHGYDLLMLIMTAELAHNGAYLGKSLQEIEAQIKTLAPPCMKKGKR